MRGIASIHHLGKSLLPKMAPSSSSEKIIPVHAGVVIKEKEPSIGLHDDSDMERKAPQQTCYAA